MIDISSIDTRDDEAEHSSKEKVGRLVTAWREKEAASGYIQPTVDDRPTATRDAEKSLEKTLSRSSQLLEQQPRERANWVSQTGLLVARGWKDTSRNYGQTVGFVLQAILYVWPLVSKFND